MWPAIQFAKKGGSLDNAIRDLRRAVYQLEGVREPPTRRPVGGPDESVDAAAVEEGAAL